MQHLAEVQERRTSADVVFDYLYEQISSLDLMPGDKISEAEIASKFGVSRQPVRDAFSRLGNLDLLLIRPQKATVVKKFSLDAIMSARFVRLSVELEVLQRALDAWDGSLLSKFEDSLALQHKAYKAEDVDEFHAQDYQFHKLLCRAANSDFAFGIIQKNKAVVDRLCVLSLTADDGMQALIKDHETLIEQMKSGDCEGLRATIRQHLSRLDGTIDDIYKKHAEFFES